MTKRTLAWFADPVKLLSGVAVLVALSGLVVNFFVADAMQKKEVDLVKEDVGKISEQVTAHDQEIESTERQYMLIQQTLGQMSDTLQELKTRKR
jgi:hypothetical protein